mmetsp:Transcript_10507/g.9423  ORF Transcript_10507/g.9423 Transcript_10507/m.9423 type:complete len:117 (-) Transcript_10507:145-495(-)
MGSGASSKKRIVTNKESILEIQSNETTTNNQFCHPNYLLPLNTMTDSMSHDHVIERENNSSPVAVLATLNGKFFFIESENYRNKPNNFNDYSLNDLSIINESIPNQLVKEDSNLNS